MRAYDQSKFRTARKRRACDRCHLSIYPGQKYLAYEPWGYTVHLCFGCAFAQGMTGDYYYRCKALEDELARRRAEELKA